MRGSISRIMGSITGGAVAACAVVSPLAGQALTVDDILVAWDNTAETVIASARAMPAEHYGFTPGDPLRTFAQQINHTTISNFAFAYAVDAGQPDFPVPDRSNPPLDKAGVTDILEKSFDYFRGGLAGLSQDSLEEMVPWGGAANRRQITRLKAILIVIGHIQSEHGKTMMYLRAQGIVPPPNRGWS